LTKIIAGFECGTLPWNGHDLLHTTRHTPDGDMPLHYQTCLDHGINWCRDGLVGDHDILERLLTAKHSGMSVIWDLSHYHRYDDPVRHAYNIAQTYLKINNGDRSKTLWVCPANEPSIVPMMRPDMTRQESIDIGYAMTKELKRYLNVKVLSVDVPGSDAFVDIANIVGINTYPHTVDRPIHEYLIEAHNQFKKPIAISETSWHNGFHFEENISNKKDWLNYTCGEIKLAKSKGVDVPFICYYPFVSCPPWDEPEAEHYWDHGFIDPYKNIDEGLSESFKEFKEAI